MIGTTTITLICLGAYVSCLVSNIAGIGGGVLMLAWLTLFLPFQALIPIHGIAQLTSNTFGAYFLRSHIRWQYFFYYAPGVVIGSALSAHIISRGFPQEAAYLLLCLLIGYTVFKPKKMPEIQLPAWGYLPLGFTQGVLAPIIGASGPMLAPFIFRSDLSKEEIIANKSALILVTHLMKIPVFLYVGFDYLEYWQLILALVIIMILTTKKAVWILKKIDEKLFRKVIKVALFLAMIRLAYKVYEGLT